MTPVFSAPMTPVSLPAPANLSVARIPSLSRCIKRDIKILDTKSPTSDMTDAPTTRRSSPPARRPGEAKALRPACAGPQGGKTMVESAIHTNSTTFYHIQKKPFNPYQSFSIKVNGY